MNKDSYLDKDMLKINIQQDKLKEVCIDESKYLQNKRKRNKEKESNYTFIYQNKNKIIIYGNKEYHPIRYVRDTNNGATRTKNYYCELHENPALLGQMESVGRHYADFHPELLYNLKDVMGLRDFLQFRCRVFINRLIKYYPDQFDPYYENNSREVLTEMVFDYKTINFIENYVKGNYSNNNHTCYSCVPYQILNSYINLAIKYLTDFRSCIKNLKYICTDENIDMCNAIKFENFSELDLFRCKNKQAYFLISENNNNINNKEDNIIEDKKEEPIDNNKKELSFNDFPIKFRKKESYFKNEGKKDSLNNLKGILPNNLVENIIPKYDINKNKENSNNSDIKNINNKTKNKKSKIIRNNKIRYDEISISLYEDINKKEEYNKINNMFNMSDKGNIKNGIIKDKFNITNKSLIERGIKNSININKNNCNIFKVTKENAPNNIIICNNYNKNNSFSCGDNNQINYMKKENKNGIFKIVSNPKNKSMNKCLCGYYNNLNNNMISNLNKQIIMKNNNYNEESNINNFNNNNYNDEKDEYNQYFYNNNLFESSKRSINDKSNYSSSILKNYNSSIAGNKEYNFNENHNMVLNNYLLSLGKENRNCLFFKQLNNVDEKEFHIASILNNIKKED